MITALLSQLNSVQLYPLDLKLCQESWTARSKSAFFGLFSSVFNKICVFPPPVHFRAKTMAICSLRLLRAFILQPRLGTGLLTTLVLVSLPLHHEDPADLVGPRGPLCCRPSRCLCPHCVSCRRIFRPISYRHVLCCFRSFVVVGSGQHDREGFRGNNHQRRVHL